MLKSRLKSLSDMKFQPVLSFVFRCKKPFFMIVVFCLLVFICFLTSRSGSLQRRSLDGEHIDRFINERFQVGQKPSKQNATTSFTGPVNKEQEEIVAAFQHAWGNYRRYAWGRDELKPLSRGWINWSGLGLTIVDSLDTMWIMGLTNEFKVARDWVASNLTFSWDGSVQLFEVVIRVLGGLLSIYHLSGDSVFLTKAIDLGNALSPCFRLNHGIPCSRIHLQRGNPVFGDISTAEVGTIGLELRDLSRSGNIETFERVAKDISLHLHRLEKLDGLVSTFLDKNGMLKKSDAISVGASADSYYEYLLKQWIQTGKKHMWLKEDYLEAVRGIRKHLLRHSNRRHLAFVGSYSNWNLNSFRSQMEHLACFLPGTLALGVLHGLDPSHLELAENLTTTCYEMYEQSATGLGPEVVGFGVEPDDVKDITFLMNSLRNYQRPETVESLYYMYIATRDEKYRHWGWKIFQAFEKYSRVPGGYACVKNVNSKEPEYEDKMESFFLAETLKYLYLLFGNNSDLLPFERFVFNTEAHPLPIYDG